MYAIHKNQTEEEHFVILNKEIIFYQSSVPITKEIQIYGWCKKAKFYRKFLECLNKKYLWNFGSVQKNLK